MLHVLDSQWLPFLTDDGFYEGSQKSDDYVSQSD
jgi:hypothetical protein